MKEQLIEKCKIRSIGPIVYYYEEIRVQSLRNYSIFNRISGQIYFFKKNGQGNPRTKQLLNWLVIGMCLRQLYTFLKVRDNSQ